MPSVLFGAEYPVLFALSGLAYTFFCLLLARITLPGPWSGEQLFFAGNNRNAGFPPYAEPLAAILGALSFLVIPPGGPAGGLPAFWNIPCGAAVWLALLILAQALFLRPFAFRAAFLLLIVRPALLAGFFALAALYARKNGMPGSLTAFDGYAAYPLWQFPGALGRTGLALLTLALLPSLVPPWRLDEAPCQRVWRLSLAAVFVTLFAPWNPAAFLSPPRAMPQLPAVLGFFFFWVKTLLAAYLLPLPAAFLRFPLPRLLCAAAAAALLL